MAAVCGTESSPPLPLLCPYLSGGANKTQTDEFIEIGDELTAQQIEALIEFDKFLALDDEEAAQEV